MFNVRGLYVRSLTYSTIFVWPAVCAAPALQVVVTMLQRCKVRRCLIARAVGAGAQGPAYAAYGFGFRICGYWSGSELAGLRLD